MKNDYPVNGLPPESQPLGSSEPVFEQPQEQAKIWSRIKNIPKKIWIPAISLLLVIAVTVPILCVSLSNTYKTPLKLMGRYRSSKNMSDYFENSISMLNGYGEDEATKFFNLIEDTEYFEELLEWREDYFEESIEALIDEYGEDYKYQYIIVDKDKLDKDDLKDFRKKVKTSLEYLEEEFAEADDYDSDKWEEVADDMGVSKSDAKKLYRALEDLIEAWKNIEVTDGYELTVVPTITGSELDEPEEEDEVTIYVYKVNGRWILSDVFQYISFMF